MLQQSVKETNQTSAQERYAPWTPSIWAFNNSDHERTKEPPTTQPNHHACTPRQKSLASSSYRFFCYRQYTVGPAAGQDTFYWLSYCSIASVHSGTKQRVDCLNARRTSNKRSCKSTRKRLRSEASTYRNPRIFDVSSISSDDTLNIKSNAGQIPSTE